jgi:hypothetical protein
MLAIRTDPAIHRLDACDAFAVSPHVSGRLVIEPFADFADAYLVATSNVRIEVAWPDGFTAVARTPPELLDERGVAIYRAGDIVTLAQVPVSAHAGTDQDPYVLIGLVDGVCWGTV